MKWAKLSKCFKNDNYVWSTQPNRFRDYVIFNK